MSFPRGSGLDGFCLITATKTRDEAVSILRQAGLPAAPINTYTESSQDPHVIERDMLQDTELPNGVNAPITGPAVKFSRTPTKVRSRAPEIGEHNAEILASIGLDKEAQDALAEAGVIG